jgi:hypothetical protein
MAVGRESLPAFAVMQLNDGNWCFNDIMKSSLFARPNLKVFLFGGLLLIVLNDLLRLTPFQASARTVPAVAKTGSVSEDELLRLLEHAARHPGYEVYMKISYGYEKRGDFKRAMDYLIRADRFFQMEEEAP